MSKQKQQQKYNLQSVFHNRMRSAWSQVRNFFKKKHIKTTGIGVKRKPLIQLFAEQQGLVIPPNKGVNNWLVELYLSGTCDDCKQLQTESEIFYSSSAWLNLRKEVLAFYGSTCMKCYSEENIHVDHIKPRSLYPELGLVFDNLQVLCQSCNSKKSNKNINDYRPI